ncbi:MAG: UvrB/UvrC motif-containing protein [Planctomycetota bacterium]|jgi:protein arginine kinase activator
MICQSCGKEVATVHLTEIEKGKRREVHLCESCAQQKGVVGKAPSLQEILGGMIQQQIKAMGEEGMTKCPFCGIRFAEFRAKGRLGCPNDYEVFHKTLVPLVEKLQGGASQHRGRVPTRLGDEITRDMMLRKLKLNLDEMIKKEDYEGAAKLRDEIRRLEEADAV